MPGSGLVKLSGKAMTVTIGVIVVVSGLIVGAVFYFGSLQRSTAEFRGETDQIEQIQADGDYRIANYDHFFDLCGAVQAQEGKIETFTKQLDEGNLSGSQTGITQANLTAATNKRIELITQYNADASKADTKANFLASNLPDKLDKDAEETTCSVR